MAWFEPPKDNPTAKDMRRAFYAAVLALVMATACQLGFDVKAAYASLTGGEPTSHEHNK